MKKTTDGSAGFTLLEILISVGILATVGTLIAQVLFTTTHVNTKANLLQDIKQNGEYALDVMVRGLRSARTVTSTCIDPTVTSTASAWFIDDENNTISYLCVSDGISARIASVSASGTEYLTGSNVTLSAAGGVTCSDSTLTFTCPPANGINAPITINFSLGQLGATTSAYTSARSSFESTVSLRN